MYVYSRHRHAPSREGSLRIQVLFTWFFQCTDHSSSTFLRRHKQCVNFHSPTLSIPLRLLPSCAPLCTKKNLVEDVFQTFLQSLAFVVHTALLTFWSNHRVLHFVVESPCCQSHMLQVPVSLSHRVNFPLQCYTQHLRPLYRNANNSSSRCTIALVSTHVALRHTPPADHRHQGFLSLQGVHGRKSEKKTLRTSSIDSVLQCYTTPSDQR